MYGENLTFKGESVRLTDLVELVGNQDSANEIREYLRGYEITLYHLVNPLISEKYSHKEGQRIAWASNVAFQFLTSNWDEREIREEAIDLKIVDPNGVQILNTIK